MKKKTTKYKVTLPLSEREQLLELISRGKPSARKANRARILLKADEGWTDQEIVEALNVGQATVSRIRQKYVEGGLLRALTAKAHAARPRKFDGRQEITIIATACSPVPDGHDHWTVRMLADKVVELEMVESVSPETIRQVLKKTNLNPGKKSSGVWLKSGRIS